MLCVMDTVQTFTNIFTHEIFHADEKRNLTENLKVFQKWLRILQEKEKVLITTVFSFSCNVLYQN